MSFNYVSLPTNDVIPLMTETDSSVMTKAMQAEPTEITKEYLIRGYNSAAAARNALVTYLYTLAGSKLPTLEGLPLKNIEVNNTGAENQWIASVTFSAYEPLELSIIGGLLRSNYTVPAIRKDQMSLSSGGENDHLYYSYNTQWRCKGNVLGDTSPLINYNNAIEYNNSEIAGVDVPVPSTAISIEFYAPQDWLTSTVTVSSSYVTKHGNTTWVGDGTYSRLKLLNLLCGSINYTTWSPFDFEKGCVKFVDWQAEPTFFETKKAGSNEKIKDWYYSINMNFSYKAPRYITTKDSTTYTAEGWDHVWYGGTFAQVQYNNAKIGFKQYNSEQIYEYGNFGLLGFSWWT